MGNDAKGKSYSTDELKAAARGRWPEILSRIGGIDAERLNGRNHPCPKCGGKDRFRMIDAEAGAVFCNQCFNSNNGDGLAALQWLGGKDFRAVCHELGDYLRLSATPATTTATAPAKGNIVATYDYRNERGELVLQVVRMEPKDFRQRRPKAGGGWDWSTKGTRLIPYRLPELTASDAAQIVYVPEGEKDCDRLANLGAIATTNAGGAGKWKAEHAAYLRGRRVAILPDNDRVGIDHARAVAKSLQGIAAEVKIITLPGLPEKGDVSDFLNAGGTPEQLETLVAEAPQWSEAIAPPETARRETEAAEPAWCDPEPLPPELPEVMPFNYACLPQAFEAWVRDIAERIQCPIDFVAVAAMVALSGIVGRKIGVRPKRRDNWTVVPNLWGVVVGRPGVMKTPAMMEPLKPLKRLEIAAKTTHQEAMRDYEAERIVADAAKKGAIKAIEQKAAKDRTAALEAARELVMLETERPQRRRYLLKDSTVEKLGEILNENPNGVTVERDELAGLLRYLDDEKNAAARAFYLEAWNGTNRYTFDRIGRGTIDIESTTLAIIGGTQPGVLRDYLRDALRGGRGDDGMMQRFQLAVWPDVSRAWENIDRWPDTQAKRTAHDVFSRIDAIDPEAIGAERDDDDPDAIPFLRFDAEAQTAFDSWRRELETRLRNDSEHPAMESHLAKYRSLIPSLALLVHLADGGTGPIPQNAVRLALKWSDYLESHARRIYSLAATPGRSAAGVLAKKLLAGELEDDFTERTIKRKHWGGLERPEDVTEALELLADLSWVRRREEQTGGRPRISYAINPRILERIGKPSAKSDEREPTDDTQATFGTFDTRFLETPSEISTDDESEVQQWIV